MLYDTVVDFVDRDVPNEDAEPRHSESNISTVLPGGILGQDRAQEESSFRVIIPQSCDECFGRKVPLDT